MMKLPSIKSLYGQIFAIFWLTLFLVLIAVQVALSSDPRQQRSLDSESKQRFEFIAERFSEKLTAFANFTSADYGDRTIVPERTLIRKIAQLEEERSNVGPLRFYFTSVEGVLLFPSSQKSYSDIRNFIAQADEPNDPKQEVFGRQMFSGPFVVTDGHQEIYLYIGQQWRDKLPFYIELLDHPFQLLLVTMLVSTPLLLWLAWAVTRPARRLQEAAERVAKGYFEKEPSLEKGPQEFRQAGASFNQMVGALNQMLNNQQRLLSDISHELGSPLTRLRMANALAIRKQGESKELDRINTEVERMGQMVAALLSLSHMQLDSQIERDTYTIEDLWLPLLDDAQFEAEQLGKHLTYSALPNIQIEGNAALLCSALENVVRNAVKYSSQNIEVQFSIEQEMLKISVSDDGQGVPENELKDIFRPFYRVSSARDRQSGGTGLGLAITDTAVNQHNGSAQAVINQHGGLTVHLAFPYAASK